MSSQERPRGEHIEEAQTLMEPGSSGSVDAEGGTVLAEAPEVVQTGQGASGEQATSTEKAPFVADPLIGQELCNYKIIKKIAEGGMGVVYLGEHNMIGRQGAIKVLRLEYCQDEQVVQRFYQEARAVNTIQHENIVDIYDFGRTSDGRVFFVMELLEGESLADRLRRGPLKFSESLPLLEQTLRALKAAHEKGFVHRDLKPDNIFLAKRDGPPQVKLLDFGIAKLVGMDGAQEKLTRTGSIIGTPHYMSPEQIEGRDVDLRTDIYALGIIMYEIWTGKTPFQGDTLGQIIKDHLLTPPPRLKSDVSLALGVPVQAADIIDRALRKNKTERYSSVEEMLSDIKAVAQNRQISSATLSTTAEPQPPSPAQAAPQLQWQAPSPPPSAPSSSAGHSEESFRTVSPAPRSSMLIPGLLGGALAVVAGVYFLFLKNNTSAEDPAKANPTGAAIIQPAPTPPEEPKEPVFDYEKLREDALVLLRASLREAEPAVRVEGSDALGEVRDTPSIPSLVELLEKDPDAEVRGHAAGALGQIGDPSVIEALKAAQEGAEPGLSVWLAEALARLGDKNARKALEAAAEQKDLAISFKAALALGELAKPGDNKAISLLLKLVPQEAALNEIAPYAGAVLLTRLARLGDQKARGLLLSLLESPDERAQLAAAEGLARLGDDSGQAILKEILANEASLNRLVAARTLILLGDYSGYELLTEKLNDKDPAVRRMAARGLGDIGEQESVAGLVKGLSDEAWTVRIASAVALLAIVGLDPQVLAQASVDWARSALASEDWAVRQAAASVIGDIPEEKAVPLLAQAMIDPDPKVRIAAARSAGKLKGKEAATQLATVLQTENDTQVKEEVVKSLGSIGNPVVKDTLAEIAASDSGRLGVYASGSLIAVGDESAATRLESAIEDTRVEIRIAAAEAALYAANPVVVPTLVSGVDDSKFEVRFLSAEGLAQYRAEKEIALPVLEEGLRSRRLDIQARAMAGLTRFGEVPEKAALTPEALLASNDPQMRLQALPIIKAASPREAIPLLRRVLADPEAEVRRQGIEVLGVFAKEEKEDVVKLAKQRTKDSDPVCVAKAQAMLSQLVDPPVKTASVAPPAEPTEPTTTAAVVDTTVVKELAAAAASALENTRAKADDIKAQIKKLEELMGTSEPDDALVKEVGKLSKQLSATADEMEASAKEARTKAEEAARARDEAPSEEASSLVVEAEASAEEAEKIAKDARRRTDDTLKASKEFTKSQTGDATTFLAAASVSITAGKFSAAKEALQEAERLLKSSGQSTAPVKLAYAELYDKQGASQKKPEDKLKFFKQAKRYYDEYIPKGTGKQLNDAKVRSEELGDLIAELEAELAPKAPETPSNEPAPEESPKETTPASQP